MKREQLLDYLNNYKDKVLLVEEGIKNRDLQMIKDNYPKDISKFDLNAMSVGFINTKIRIYERIIEEAPPLTEEQYIDYIYNDLIIVNEDDKEKYSLLKLGRGGFLQKFLLSCEEKKLTKKTKEYEIYRFLKEKEKDLFKEEIKNRILFYCNYPLSVNVIFNDLIQEGIDINFFHKEDGTLISHYIYGNFYKPEELFGWGDSLGFTNYNKETITTLEKLSEDSYDDAYKKAISERIKRVEFLKNC